MAKISDLKLAYRVFMKAYPYRKVDWPPGARLKTPLSDARVAVVTTAAFFRPDQPPFDTSIRGGDYSYRIIPIDTDLSTLNIAHRSDAFDIRGITSDKNLALPLDHRVVDAPSDWFPIPATVAASEETGTPSSAVHLEPGCAGRPPHIRAIVRSSVRRWSRWRRAERSRGPLVLRLNRCHLVWRLASL